MEQRKNFEDFEIMKEYDLDLSFVQAEYEEELKWKQNCLVEAFQHQKTRNSK